MVSGSLDRVFHALADPTRRSMVEALLGGPLSIGGLAEPFRGSMSVVAASKHVRVLESAAIVQRSVRGRLHLCRLNTEPLRAADGWIEASLLFWNARLDTLSDVLSEDASRS